MDAIKSQEQWRSLVEQKQKLDSQINELTMAKEEVDLLETDALVYKLIGPLMVTQKLPEVNDNIQARMKFLNDKMSYYDQEIKQLQTTLMEQRQQLQLQKQTIVASAAQEQQ